MRLGWTGVVGFVGIIVACATAPVPAPTSVAPSNEAAPSTPSAVPETPIPSATASPNGTTLYIENRGGPAFNVTIDGVFVATVPCDGYPTINVGDPGVPSLPWDVQIARVSDDLSLWSGSVTDLPRWYVQIGSESLGMNGVVLGPPGPPCPSPLPVSELASPLPGQMAYLLDRMGIRFWPLTNEQLATVEVTAAQAAQAAMKVDADQTHKILVCEFLGLFIREIPNHGDPIPEYVAYMVLTTGAPFDDGESGTRVMFIDAASGDLIEVVGADEKTGEALAWNCGLQPA